MSSHQLTLFPKVSDHLTELILRNFTPSVSFSQSLNRGIESSTMSAPSPGPENKAKNESGQEDYHDQPAKSKEGEEAVSEWRLP